MFGCITILVFVIIEGKLTHHTIKLKDLYKSINMLREIVIIKKFLSQGSFFEAEIRIF